MKPSLRWEWSLLTLCLLALTVWLSPPQQLPRANGWLHDLLARWQPAPPAPEVVLVLADERSLAAIGRWPWRRALHAHVLQHIDQGQPQSITLNFLLPEADWDYPADDQLLAHAMARSGRVLLPVARGADAHSAVLPLPLFAQAAQRLGHVHVPLDADGGVRSFYAREALGQQAWLHLGLSLACVSHPAAAGCADTIAPHSRHAPPDAATPASAVPAPQWTPSGLHHIRFARPQPGFVTYAYIDVLRGQIPPSAFRNKHVLIGTAAAGLGSSLATPSAPGHSQLYSTELLAHIASGALQGLHTASASPAVNVAFNLVPVLLGLLALYLLGPSAALLSGAVLGLLTLLLAALASMLWQLALAPAAALLALTLAYPLWSWRRLNAAARFLTHEMQALQLPGLPAGAKAGGDFVHNRIQAVEQASQQLRQLHHLVTETLLQLPSPTLACDAQGRVLLANSAAHRYAAELARPLQPLQPLADLLYGATLRDSQQPLWDALAPPPLHQPLQREGTDSLQRNLLLLSQPFHVQRNHGYLISLVDVSALHQAMAQRDQAMHFISHDIRAPIGAILTIIEMAQHLPTDASPAQVLARIAESARTSLALADDFVQLARVQHSPPVRTPLALQPLIDQALDDCWAAAQARQVQLQWQPPAPTAWVLGDASALRRACVNLLGNAIKYGPPEAVVVCSLHAAQGHWVIGVQDAGAGLTPEEQSRLFAPFARLAQHVHSRLPGTGLGLAYVHTVAQQHGGHVQVHSQPGAGSLFALHVPQAPAPADEDLAPEH